MRTTPGTIREISPEIFLQTDRSCDGTDTDHYMQPDVDTSVEQPDPTPTNHWSSKIDRRHNPKPRFIDDYRYYIESAHYRLRNAYVHFPEFLGMCYGTDTRKLCIFFQAPSSLSQVTIENYRSIHTNFGIRRNWKSDFHYKALINAEMIYGAFPEPIRKSHQFWFRIQHGIHTKNSSILRIIPVQRHVFYSF